MRDAFRLLSTLYLRIENGEQAWWHCSHNGYCNNDEMRWSGINKCFNESVRCALKSGSSNVGKSELLDKFVEEESLEGGRIIKFVKEWSIEADAWNNLREEDDDDRSLQVDGDDDNDNVDKDGDADVDEGDDNEDDDGHDETNSLVGDVTIDDEVDFIGLWSNWVEMKS